MWPKLGFRGFGPWKSWKPAQRSPIGLKACNNSASVGISRSAMVWRIGGSLRMLGILSIRNIRSGCLQINPQWMSSARLFIHYCWLIVGINLFHVPNKYPRQRLILWCVRIWVSVQRYPGMMVITDELSKDLPRTIRGWSTDINKTMQISLGIGTKFDRSMAIGKDKVQYVWIVCL